MDVKYRKENLVRNEIVLTINLKHSNIVPIKGFLNNGIKWNILKEEI